MCIDVNPKHYFNYWLQHSSCGCWVVPCKHKTNGTLVVWLFAIHLQIAMQYNSCVQKFCKFHVAHTQPNTTYYSKVVEAVGNDICDVVRVYFQACHGFWIFFSFFSSARNFCILHGNPNLRDLSTKNNIIIIQRNITKSRIRWTTCNKNVWTELVFWFLTFIRFIYHFSQVELNGEKK